MHAANADGAGERRADRLLRDFGLRFLHRTERHIPFGQRIVQLLPRGGVEVHQLAHARQQQIGIAQLRLQAHQLSLLDRIVELHQQLSLPHRLAGFEQNARDAAAGLRRHCHWLAASSSPTPA